MHSRTPWILFAVAATLFGYLWFFDAPRAPEGPDAEAPLLFPDLNPALVSAVTLVQSNTPLRLERAGDGWQMTDPSYPAQRLVVGNWLESIAQLRRLDQLSAAEVVAQTNGLAALGLDPPRATVTLEQGSRRFQFRLGDRLPLPSKMYLQQLGGDGVQVVDAQPLDRLPATLNDWRDARLVDLAGLGFDQIQMRSAAREYDLARTGAAGRWRLAKPRPARADVGRVEQMLQTLQALEIREFLMDVPVTDLEAYGLQKPEAVFGLLQGTNRVLTLEFGRSPTNDPSLVYVRRSDLPGLVAAPRAALDLVAVPYSDLLDYRLVDRPVREAQRVEVVADETFTLERETNGIWRLTQPALPTDPGLTALFLDQVRDLQVLDVAKEVVTELDLATYGLATPVRQYSLAWPGPTNDPSTGAVLRLDFGTNRADRVLVRRSDETPVYEVALKDALNLPRAAYQLRERRLWNFTTNQVTALTMVQQGVTNQLLRSPRGHWTFASGSQGMVNTFALEEALQRLGTLRARYWAGRGSPALAEFGIPQVGHRLVVEIVRDGTPESLALDFGASSPSGGPFAAIDLEGEPTVFECPLDVFYPYEEVIRSLTPAR